MTSTSRSSGNGDAGSASCGASGTGRRLRHLRYRRAAAASSSLSSSKAWATAAWPRCDGLRPTDACMTMTRGGRRGRRLVARGLRGSANAGAAAVACRLHRRASRYRQAPRRGLGGSGRSIGVAVEPPCRCPCLHHTATPPLAGDFPVRRHPDSRNEWNPSEGVIARWLRIRDGRRTGRCAPGRPVNWSLAAPGARELEGTTVRRERHQRLALRCLKNSPLHCRAGFAIMFRLFSWRKTPSSP